MFSLLRRNRDIRLVFGAQVVSYMGDWFTFVAMAGLVEDVTGSRFLVSLVLVSMTLPGLLMSAVAGAFADRFDRRRILVVVSVLQAVAACGLLLHDVVGIWVTFLSQSLIAGLAAFVGPCTNAAIPNLADNEDDLRRANALFGSTWGIMLAVGAAIGGVFSSLFGRDAAFIADAVSFAVAAVLFAGVRRPMQAERTAAPQSRRVRPLADMAEALHVARANPVILALICSKATFAVGAGIVSQLAVLASQAFSVGDAGRGLLIGVRGVGSGLGPIIGARIAGRDMPRLLRVCGVAGMLFSVCYLGAALSPVIGMAAVFVALAHLSGGAQWTLSTLGLQIESPDHVRGRVLAGDMALVNTMIACTSLLAGLVSQAIGVRETIVVFSAAAAVASTTYLTATTGLRRRLRSEQQR
ncbi:MAG: MFS transporter [Actinobacteria bacterium]|nr:MFS transporter [Actinomycetota bacterium]NBR66473.1 MFS transporter [Actinomycetota bacterium]